MAPTRRQFVAALAAATAAPAQTPARPLVCLYSQAIIDVELDDLPVAVKSLGFDGCNLAVRPGGHVAPQHADLYLMPALESLTGAGLEVPIISTGLASLTDPQTAEVLGLAGIIGVPYFRPKGWRFDAPAPALLREIAGLAAAGRAYKSAMGIQNTRREGGAAVADVLRTIRALDPRWVGFDFDPSRIEGGPDALGEAFALAQGRLKMVTARDCRAGGEPCPLGEGAVDWPRFCAMLARAKFAGPITIEIDYKPEDKPAAIRRDLVYLRAELDKAYRPPEPHA